MIIHRGLVVALLAAVVVSSGADTKDAKKTASRKGGEKAAEKDVAPACMHCGATCGLAPVCVCESGTKKKPKNEFDVTCEPVCIPACSHGCWPFGCHSARTSCSSCCAEPGACASRVRYCKKVTKETTDEEVLIVERKVKYVCDCCAGRGGGCCGATSRPRPSAWWTSLTWWWPRKPAE